MYNFPTKKITKIIVFASNPIQYYVRQRKVELSIILLARRAQQGLPSANSGNKGGAEEGGDTNSYEQSNLEQQKRNGRPPFQTMSKNYLFLSQKYFSFGNIQIYGSRQIGPNLPGKWQIGPQK